MENVKARHKRTLSRTPLKRIIPAAMLSLLWLAPSAQAQMGELLPLERLTTEVVTSHPGVAAKRAGVDEAEAGIDAAKSQYLPTPSIQTNRLSGGRHATNYVLSQPLWAAGRLDAGLEAARAKTRSAEGSVLETQYTLALRVADLYQSYLASRGRQTALRAGVTRLQELDEMMRRRQESGVSAAVDRELGVSRLAQARADLAFEESAGRAVLAQLSQLAGHDIAPGAIGTGNIRRNGVEDETTLIERALANHPALRRATADIEAALAEAERLRAALWPTLSLQGEYKTDSRSSVKDTHEVFLALQYQPGAGLSATAQARGAGARAAGLRDTLEAIRRDLVDGLRVDHERYRAAQARVRDVRSTVESSAEILASYRRLFIAGKRGWLDVVNAARELTQSEQSLADLEAVLDVGPYRMKLRTGDVAWGGQ